MRIQSDAWRKGWERCEETLKTILSTTHSGALKSREPWDDRKVNPKLRLEEARKQNTRSQA